MSLRSNLNSKNIFILYEQVVIFKLISGMSLEAGNQRKSLVTLAVTAGYFFSLKKKMRENLVSAIQRSVCNYWSACLRLQIFTYKHRYISSNPNNISRYFPLNADEIVDGEGLNYPGYIFLFFFSNLFRNIAMNSEWRFTKL
jgi:hypothetical protein